MIYLMPPPNARMSEVTVSGAGTAPQPANNIYTPSATGASVESGTPPPAYDSNGGLEVEQVDVLEKS